MVIRNATLGLCLSLVLGCSVESTAEATGGVDFGQGRADGCDRGFAVLQSDYKSTNIAVSELDGTTLSGSFVSSGSKTPGLSLAISGDVDVPHLAPASGALVLIDRFGTNVLTWMDLQTASAIAQLPIGQGFESNPQDYVEVGQRAFVSRFGTNPAPGAQEFDAGGDLLILDLTERTRPVIAGRIAMPEEDPKLYPRPAGMTRLGSELVVTLGRTAPDFSVFGDGRFVGVSPVSDSVQWVVDLSGLSSCGRVAISPDSRRLAIACSSTFDMKTERYELEHSDIVLFDATTTPPTELKRFGLANTLGAALQPAIAFASNDLLLGKTFGGSASADSLFALHLETGVTTSLAQAGAAYVFNDLRCSPGCGDICLMGDAEQSVLRRFLVRSDGSISEQSPITVETSIGLPPRSIGAL